VLETTEDETGLLMKALKDMNQSLFRIVSNVRACTDNITTSSKEIAAGNLDLSNRTEAQAQSLADTVQAMDVLATTVRTTAEKAEEANALAGTASEIALRGGEVVAKVVGTMKEINSSSKKIVDIISVIDGIAFQTNILSLNAAVEAARAGEQGRGFAVVATEVRSLALRSAQAAKQIKELIAESARNVETGGTLVLDAGATMKDIVNSVDSVTARMNDIMAATKDQSDEIVRINNSIANIDYSTQQNSALVEEAAATAASMQMQATELARTVSIFSLGEPELTASEGEILLCIAN
jgi:methyl-accepting chemotaxis protein